VIETAATTTSAAIVFVLGAVHLAYTFFGEKLRPRDPQLAAQMEEDSPQITRETTMARAWVGFNASHSMGAILFGIIYANLALEHPTTFYSSWVIQGAGLVFLCSMCVLAKKYWFRIPLVGLAIATISYVIGMIAA